MKTYKYLLSFVGIFSLLSFGHIFVAFKYFQILIHHSLYYCQEMAKALSVQFSDDIGKTIALLLLAAIFFTLFKIILAVREIVQFRKSLQNAQLTHNRLLRTLADKLQLQNKIVLFEHIKPQAFCFGIRNPRIYISSGLVKLMNRAELEGILRHEKYHLEHRDTITLLLASVTESVFLFFPVVSDFIRIYRAQREVEADKAAIAQGSKSQSLKDVLRKLIQFEPVTHPRHVPGIAGADTLETRIQILSYIKPAQYKIGIKNILLSIFSLGALILLIVAPVYAIELHTDDQDVVILCDQPQNRSVVPTNFSSAF